MYYPSEIHEALEEAGLVLLREVDSETWGKPTHKTVRVEMIAGKKSGTQLGRNMDKLVEHIQDVLSDLGH